MLAITHSATLQGVTAVSVTVEANGGEKGEPALCFSWSP